MVTLYTLCASIAASRILERCMQLHTETRVGLREWTGTFQVRASDMYIENGLCIKAHKLNACILMRKNIKDLWR